MNAAGWLALSLFLGLYKTQLLNLNFDDLTKRLLFNSIIGFFHVHDYHVQVMIYE